MPSIIRINLIILICLTISACGVSSAQPNPVGPTQPQATAIPVPQTVAPQAQPTAQNQPQATINLSVDVASNQHPISPLIYGINNAGQNDAEYAALVTALRIPLIRWGGNATTRYNWQNDFYNTANDYYFENIPSENPDNTQLPNNSAADRFVQRNRAASVQSIITVPLIGWVAKAKADSSLGHPFDCGFKVSKYGAQKSVDKYDTDCGNGVHQDDTLITGNDPTDTSVAIGAPFVQNWVSHLVTQFGNASDQGVRFYGLDNEPGIWSGTHRDIFPGYLSYQDLLDRTITYAAAIRAGDSSAQILGPVQDGWTRYFYSGYRNYPDATAQADRDSHSGQAFVAWYLDQLYAYQQQHSMRLIDYFDLHYYPQAGGVALSPAGDTANQALRLRSTRSLWDASYVDESWIKDTEGGNTAVRLIPRMREWVAQHYPGLKLAISEYNWGALDDINGALAQADVLGIFGREQVDLATLWDPPTINQPGAFAFRMYRNYDGNGNGFGDLSTQSTSSDHSKLAIYAARRSIDGAVTIMLINKTSTTISTLVALNNLMAAGPVARYQYSAANLGTIEVLPAVAVQANTINATLPAESITLFVIPGSAGYRSYLPSVRAS